MGIENLWGILPLDERVSFPVFLTQFLKEHGRPPRFAIDAYMFMFWSLVSNSDDYDPLKESYDIRNFMAKLWYLIQTNVSFVVVFDGAHKPQKLRNGHIPDTPGSISYDEHLDSFLKLHRTKFSERLRLVDTLKEILSRNRISWEQAPGEAEAQCAWVQKLGIVDYVISDDSDTLVFGATGVLRWFTRVKYYKDDKEPVNSPTDYYVTPVHMSNVTKKTSLTREHLVFIAVLRGGDYSRGADSIGITRAKELALCGTAMQQKKARATAQDFGSFENLTRLFVETFVLSEKTGRILLDPFFGRKEAGDRHLSLVAFNTFLNQFLKEKANQVFGRATKFEEKVGIEDYFAMLYFFPLVNTRVFMFTPHSISFAEPEIVTTDLQAVESDSEVMRYNNVVSSGAIGKLKIKNGVLIFEKFLDLSIDKISLPRERKYNLKAFLLKFLRDKAFWSHIQLVRIKNFEGIEMAVLKFNRVKLNEFVYYERKDLKQNLEAENDLLNKHIFNNEEDLGLTPAEQQVDEEKMETLTIPLQCVKYISSEFLKRVKLQVQRRLPTKKKPLPQKTTLDSFFPRLLPIRNDENPKPYRPDSLSSKELPKLSSEQKVVSVIGDVKMEPKKLEKVMASEVPISLTHGKNTKLGLPGIKRVPMRSIHRRQRRGQKPELLPGQSTLTSFIQSKRSDKPKDKPLFVNSSGDNSEKSKGYSQGDLHSSGFSFFSPTSNIADKGRYCNDENLSPTKRHRGEMEFSQNNSPVKIRPETKESW